MAEKIFLNAEREGYAPDQIHRTMTVGELIEFLENFDEDSEVYLSHDSGYTYGGNNDSKSVARIAKTVEYMKRTKRKGRKWVLET